MSRNRIEVKLEQLKEKQEKAFITYLTAGLPDMEQTKEIVKAQEAAGTDIVEIGVPFSDPIADGPVIQQASYESILGGTNIHKCFEAVEELRAEGCQLPMIFMLYYNTICHYGVEEFVKKCHSTGSPLVNIVGSDGREVFGMELFAGNFLPSRQFLGLLLGHIPQQGLSNSVGSNVSEEGFCQSGTVRSEQISKDVNPDGLGFGSKQVNKFALL